MDGLFSRIRIFRIHKYASLKFNELMKERGKIIANIPELSD